MTDVEIPNQPHPPALWFTCPDDGCDWSWHADKAEGHEQRLARAWARHQAVRGQLTLFVPGPTWRR